MKISVRARNLSDEYLTFIKQIGVNYVDIGPNLVHESQTRMHGFHVERLDLKRVGDVIKKIREAKLDVNSFCDFPPIRHALMGKPEGENQLEDLCNYVKFLGEENIPVTQLCLETVRHGPGGVPGRYMREHGGGYSMGGFSLELMRQELLKRDLNSPWAHHFIDKMTPEEYFQSCVRVLEKVVPVAEGSGVKLMLHNDDPPVPDGEGLLPGITNSLQIRRLLEAFPSRNLGLLFCCGTRYESGENMYDLLRLFGGENKIFHVHLRNVRGTIPILGRYEEVAIDDGEINILKVLQILKEVGYDGAINADHLPTLMGDTEGKASLAYSVGYFKALISTLVP